MQPKSSFQFIDYIIRKSIFIQTGNVVSEHLSIKINPSGIINTEKSQFQLFLELDVSEGEKKPFINIEVVGLFEYFGELEDMKDFLYLNAPAILFPYIRAYISSLTSLSGLDALTLPTMNLTNLKKTLEDQTEIIELSEGEDIEPEMD